jgi:putative PEP-CTERM system TPR-repeat lipoprotein
MNHWLVLALRRVAKIAPVRRVALSITLMVALASLAACDPRGSASVDQLVKRAEEQRAAGNIRASIIELKNALQKDGKSAPARLLLGQSFVDLGDAASAEIELRRALELGADANRTKLLLGEAKILQGRFDQLLREFPVPEDAPPETRAAFLELRGRAHLSMLQRVQSEQAFRAALELNPKLAEAQVGLARIAFATGNAAAGRELIARAADTAPDNPKVLMTQGDAAFAARDFEASENFFKQVLKFRKDDLMALNASLGIGRAQIAAGKLKDATARLAQAVKQAPNHPEANYLRALAAYQSKEYDLAKTHAEAALRTAPNHRQSIFVAGAASYALQQNELALRYLTTYVNAVPENPEGRKLLAALQLRMGQASQAAKTLQSAKTQDAQMLAMAGVAAARAGDANAAKESFERAASADPQNVDARSKLGLARIATGEVQEGFKDLEAASKMAPGSEADYALATAYLRANEFDNALASANRIHEAHPKAPLGSNLAAMALRGKRDFEGSRKASQRALEIEPGNRDAMENLALVAIAENKFGEAKGIYQDMIKRNPSDLRNYLALAQLGLQSGNPQEAVSTMQSLVAGQPDLPAGHAALARAQLAAGNTGAAIETMKTATQRWPDDEDVLATAGQVFLTAGQPANAVAPFKALVARQPQSVGAYEFLATALFVSGDAAGALTQIDKALTIAPGTPGLRFQRAQFLAETGKLPEAVRIASDLRASYPQSPRFAELDGALALAQRRFDDAVVAFKAAVARDANTENVTRLATAQVGAGRPDEAEQTLKDWLQKNPGDARVRMALADRYLTRGKFADSEREYTAVLGQVPDLVAARNNLAWVLAEQGRAKDGVPHARRAAELAPDSPAVADTLGVVLLKAGQPAEAVAPLRRAAEKAPDSKVIQLHLAEALARGGQQAEAVDILRRLVAKNEPFAEADAAQKLLRDLGG